MIVKKHEVKNLFAGLDKLRTFYAHKYKTTPNKIDFVIQGMTIFVMVEKVNKEVINKIEELKTI